MRIDSVTLKAFRGATTETKIQFDRKKKIALIYGENGTGKSTIVDGIDCVCNENCGSLEDRSLDGTHKRTHLPSLGKQHQDLFVEVTSDTSKWTSNLAKSGPTTTGPLPRPIVHVLRRAKLTKLVEANAKEKYDVLASFVNVAEVERAEAELLNAVKAAKKAFDAAVERTEVMDSALEKTWKELGQPGAPTLDHVAWAEQEAARNPLVDSQKAEAAQQVIGAIEALQRAAQRLKESQDALSRLQTQKAGLLASGGSRSIGLQQQRDLLRVLEEASAFLDRAEGDGACPVCETPQNLVSLRQNLRARIGDMNASNQQLASLKQCEAELARAASQADNARKEAAQAAVSLSRLWTTAAKTLDGLPTITEAKALLQSGGDATVAEPLLPGVLQTVETCLDELKSVVQQARGDQTHLAAIRNNLSSLKSEREKAQDWEAKWNLLAMIHDEVRSMRIEFAQGVLDEVHADCEAIYEAMHPGEGIGPEALILDPDKRGSVSQPAYFGPHKGIPPAAYFSESHTDTLALALFIAVAKRQGGKDSILVLDDVFTSVDTPHLKRVIDMLAEESKQFAQVIVTTHFRRMYDLYRLHRAGLVDLKELEGWHLSLGVGICGARLELELLTETLKKRPLDRNGIASKAGYVLDATLDHISLIYETSAPRKPGGEYSLRDLYDSCRKVAKVMKVQQGKIEDGAWQEEGAEIAVEPLFTLLDGSNLIRNEVGAHFKVVGQDISDTEVNDFGKQVEALVSAVTCRTCMCLPTKAKDTYWECDCGACRTSPRKKP